MSDNKVKNKNTNFVNLTVESRGCEFCMIYDWVERKEKPADLSKVTFEDKEIKFCPFCGRRVV